MSTLTTRLVIDGQFKGGAALRQAGAALRALGANPGLGRMRAAGDAGGRSIQRIIPSARAASFALGGLGRQAAAVQSAVSQVQNSAGLRMLSRDANLAGRALGFTARKMGEVARLGAAVGAAGVTAFGVSVFRTGIKFEGFLAQLETTEGSSRKAQQAMSWVQKFAATTPNDLGTVMESFIKLRAYGIDPTDGTLRTLGNTASSMGKSVMDAVEALADAQTGEFERLKEFGVKAKVSGNQVLLAYTQNGRAMSVAARNNSADIRRALLGIWDTRFAGGMERQANTLGGILSNLGDLWTNFQKQIGDAGVFKYVKDRVSAFAASLATPAGAAKASAWAKQISDGMIKALDTLTKAFAKFDAGKFIADVATLISAGAGLVKFFGGIGGVIDAFVVGGIAKFGFIVGSIITAVVGAFGIATGPIWLTVAAVTGLVAAGYLLWRRWDTIRAWWGASWADMTASISKQAGKWGALFTGMWTAAKTAFVTGAAAIWNALPEWLQGVIQGAVFVMRLTNPIANIGAALVADSSGQRSAAKPGSAIPFSPARAAPNRASMARAAPAAARPAMVNGRAAPVAAGPAMVSRRAAPAAARPAMVGRGQSAQPTTVKSEVGGRIVIELREGAKAVVRQLKSDNPRVSLTVHRGLMRTSDG